MKIPVFVLPQKYLNLIVDIAVLIKKKNAFSFNYGHNLID